MCLQPSSFFNTYTSASNLLFVFTVPGLHNTCHLSISSLSTHLNNNPTFIPASALSKDLWNISTHVIAVFLASLPKPNNSTSSFKLITPLSILPVATVPLPLIEKTSSTGIKKSLSVSLSGIGI